MKKILSLVLASAMVASSLAGCGSSKTAETQAPTTQAPAESAAPEGSGGSCGDGCSRCDRGRGRIGLLADVGRDRASGSGHI